MPRTPRQSREKRVGPIAELRDLLSWMKDYEAKGGVEGLMRRQAEEMAGGEGEEKEKPKAVGITFSLPAPLVVALDEMRAEKGLNRNQYLSELLKAEIRRVEGGGGGGGEVKVRVGRKGGR